MCVCTHVRACVHMPLCLCMHTHVYVYGFCERACVCWQCTHVRSHVEAGDNFKCCSLGSVNLWFGFLNVRFWGYHTQILGLARQLLYRLSCVFSHCFCLFVCWGEQLSPYGA